LPVVKAAAVIQQEFDIADDEALRVLVYILLLLPTLGFLNIYFFIYSFVADHWQYLACLGIITPCASGIVLLARHFKSWQAWLEPGITLLIGGLLFLLTSQQSRMYNNVETLYRTTIARNPACWMAQVNLGNILYQANRIPEAMDLFNAATESASHVRYGCVVSAAPAPRTMRFAKRIRSPYAAFTAAIYSTLYQFASQESEVYPYARPTAREAEFLRAGMDNEVNSTSKPARVPMCCHAALAGSGSSRILRCRASRSPAGRVRHPGATELGW